MTGIIFGLITLISAISILAYLHIWRTNGLWEELCEIPKPSLVRLDYMHPMGIKKIHTLKIVSTDETGVFYREPIPIPPNKYRTQTKWTQGELEWMSKDEFLSKYLLIYPPPTKQPSDEKFELVEKFESIMEKEYNI
jgi:hypothetical protein